MVARSGLFVAPATGAGAAPIDARLAFSSLTGTTAQQASGGVTVQSASTMAFTVPAGVWQLPDATNAAATFLSPTDPFTLTPAAGPATGSRVDLFCVKQNNIENGDADSRANVILVPGTAGAPGVAPAVPTGAWLYQTVNVPAAAANAAACTVVSARPSTFAPLPIKSPTFALLGSVTGQLGQQAYVYADSTASNNGFYSWTTSWVSATSATSVSAPVPTVGYTITTANDLYSRGGSIVAQIDILKNTGTFTSATVIGVMPVGFRPLRVVNVPSAFGNVTAGWLQIDTSGNITIFFTGAAANEVFANATYRSV